MNERTVDSRGVSDGVRQVKSDRPGLWASGSAIGAMLASSCCIGPLLLLSLGVSGVWIGKLTALEPYKPYFVVATLAFLGPGYWQVYFRPKSVCKTDGYCASATANRVIKAALWFATVLVVLAATISYWAPLFY